MNILLFSRYGRLGASSRQRSYQYLPFLEKHGISITTAPLFVDTYLKQRHENKRSPALIARSYLKRFWWMAFTHRYDLVWIEKELLPWCPPWLESYLCQRSIRYIVDYDDAIFHKYDKHRQKRIKQVLGQKIDRIMKKAHLVIAGNRYLADRGRQAGAKWVEIIPTVVDLNHYPIYKKNLESPFTIGWMGSPTTAGYLKEIEPVLSIFCHRYAARVIVIGAGEKIFNQDIPAIYLPWSESIEAALIGVFDVGVMPLPDTAWSKGKCGYKLIQYMACSRPVVASKVNEPLNIVNEGINGYLVDSQSQWLKKLEKLLLNPQLADKLGKNGRQLVAEKFELHSTAPRLISLFIQAGSKPGKIL